MVTRRGFVRGGLGLTGAALGLFNLPLSRAWAQAMSDEVIAAAKAEGHVTYYSSTNPALSQLLVDAFNVEYPEISVDIVRLATGPLAQRYAAEMEANSVVADILQMGDRIILEDGYEKGWFADLTDLPAHQAWPDNFKSDSLAIVSMFPDTITYNTNLVSEAEVPKKWEDLLDSHWQGQILMVDVRNVPQTVDWALHLHDNIPDFLPRLRAQNPRYITSTVPGTQMLAAGEASLLIPNLRMVSFSMIQEGAPIDDSTPEPVSGWGSMLSITREAPNPNAARVFTSFILSEAGQTILSKDVAASPIGNLEGSLPLSPKIHIADVRKAMERAPLVYELLGLG